MTIPDDDADIEDEGALDDAVPTHGYRLVPVVGIGCADAGKDDLAAFFRTLSPQSGLAVAIAFRPSPAGNSGRTAVARHEADVEWLKCATPLRVEVVASRIRVQPDTVYVACAGKLLISRGRFLDAMVLEGPRTALPVDHLFRSLADAHGPHAIAVVLPGESEDGSVGIKRIKERGGLTIVRERAEGVPSEMVEAAIATAMIDWVLAADEIAPRVVDYCRMEAGIRLPPEDASHAAADPHDEATFHKVLEVVHRRTSRDFRNYKRATVLRRLGRRMQVNGVKTLDAYLECLGTRSGEAGALLQDMLVSVTNFFRDPQCFGALEAGIPELFAQKTPGEAMRVWVMACATGEEAYSIAMLMSEHLRATRTRTVVQVFASDLDEGAVRIAREGLYPFAIEADVSPERLVNFFDREAGGYRVKRSLREMVLFAAHDGLRDPPFSRIDLASCRNLLIYLSREAQVRVLETLHFAMRPAGRLFLGASETVDERSLLFSAADKKHRLYIPRPAPSVPGPDKRHEQPQVGGTRRTSLLLAGAVPARLRLDPPPAVHPAGSNGSSWAELHLWAIDRLAPPSVLLDAQCDMLHISSAASRYLHFSGGEPTRNLLHSILPELKAALQSAMFHAADEDQVVHTQPLGVAIGGQQESVVLTVQPLDEPEGGYLVVFRAAAAPPTLPGLALPAAEDSPLVRQLEREGARLKSVLRETVEQYETTVEELKASNEELQAINEELHSATEELETGREELQSINEEHITVNQELKVKVDDLGQSNSDMQNLMDATAIPTVFLDRDFRLTRFTPSTVGLFQLIASDMGRPLTDLTTPLQYPQLLDDAHGVLQTLQPSEREVGDSLGNWYLARVRPYRTLEDRIAGVVLSFVDITERKRAQESLRQTQERFSTIVNQATVGVAQTRLDGSITFANTSYQTLTGYTELELVGRSALSLVYGEDLAATQEQFQRLAATGEPFQSESRAVCKDGSLVWLHESVTVLADSTGKPDSALIVCTDIGERKFAEDALRDSEERLRLILENAVDYAIFSMDLQRRVTSWSTGAQRLLGYSEEEILGRSADIIFTREDRIAGAPDEEDWLARGEGRAADDRLHMRKDGSTFWASGAMMPMHDAQGAAIGLVKVLRDQSEQRAVDQELERNRGELVAALKANESARESLEAADVAKNQFLAVLSHELRNPLTSITAASELLAPELLPAPELAHAARIIQR
ncbi:MAG: PAS domain S-box protein [Janthinobacterium lividum]